MRVAVTTADGQVRDFDANDAQAVAWDIEGRLTVDGSPVVRMVYGNGVIVTFGTEPEPAR